MFCLNNEKRICVLGISQVTKCVLLPSNTMICCKNDIKKKHFGRGEICVFTILKEIGWLQSISQDLTENQV
jgi:hypothetical protein